MSEGKEKRKRGRIYLEKGIKKDKKKKKCQKHLAGGRYQLYFTNPWLILGENHKSTQPAS